MGQTVPVAAIISLTEGKAAAQIFWSLAHLSFPYYVVGAGVTAMVQAVNSHMGLELGLGLAIFAVMYGIHRSYRLYFGKTADTQRTAPLVRSAGIGA